MQNRGIIPSVVKEVLKNGTKLQERDDASLIYDSKNNVSVVVNNETQKIITVRFGK